jgi:hypothetical protein
MHGSGERSTDLIKLGSGKVEQSPVKRGLLPIDSCPKMSNSSTDCSKLIGMVHDRFMTSMGTLIR